MKKILLLPLLSLMFELGTLNPNAQSNAWQWQNPLPQGNSLRSVFFTDANTGYAVGLYGTILKTNNGGITFIVEETKIESNFIVYLNPANKGKIYINNNFII